MADRPKRETNPDVEMGSGVKAVTVELSDETIAVLTARGLDPRSICGVAAQRAAATLVSLRLTHVCLETPTFTSRVAACLLLAEKEASESRVSIINSLHIMVGLLAEGGGIAAEVLSNLGVTIEALREDGNHPESLVGAELVSMNGDLAYSAEAFEVLQRSTGQAVLDGKDYLGTEHLLVGMVATKGSLSSWFLGRLGVHSDVVRAEVADALATLARAPKIPEVHRLPSVEDVVRLISYLRMERGMDIGPGAGERIIALLYGRDASLQVEGLDVRTRETTTTDIDGETIRSILDAA